MVLLLTSLALAEPPVVNVSVTVNVTTPDSSATVSVDDPVVVAEDATPRFDAVLATVPSSKFAALRAELDAHAEQFGGCFVSDRATLSGTFQIRFGSLYGTGVGSLVRSDNLSVDGEALDCLNDALLGMSFPDTATPTDVRFIFR
ncbi:MAG: hypothetical protein WCO25_03220 [Candidatus Uhrbacteria bacterium]